MDLLIAFVLWALGSLVVGVRASTQGRSLVLWLLFAVFFSPLMATAFLWAVGPDGPVCPRCKEIVKPGASACPHCLVVFQAPPAA